MISKATIFFLFKSVICDFMVQGFSSIYDFAWVVQEKNRVSLLFKGSYIYCARSCGGEGISQIRTKISDPVPKL